VQNKTLVVYARLTDSHYAKWRRAQAGITTTRSNPMSRNIVAFAAALSVSGLFFAAVLA
jgi:hypothetical protein